MKNEIDQFWIGCLKASVEKFGDHPVRNFEALVELAGTCGGWVDHIYPGYEDSYGSNFFDVFLSKYEEATDDLKPSVDVVLSAMRKAGFLEV